MALHCTIGQLEQLLLQKYPAKDGESWDRTGLLAGDPSRPVRGVAVALDPTIPAVLQAKEAGANVLLTHHPAFLRSPESFLPGASVAQQPGALIFAALESGVALMNFHTALDMNEDGLLALPHALGLEYVRTLLPLPDAAGMAAFPVASDAKACADDAADEKADAAGAADTAAARAGFVRRGYGALCRVSNGEDHVQDAVAQSAGFNAAASVGAANNGIASARAASGTGASVVSKALGKGDPLTVGQLARRCETVLGGKPRIWGNINASVRYAVTAQGSASSLLPVVHTSGADCLICGELKYHDALPCAQAGVNIIELGHDISEFPLAHVLYRSARELGVENVVELDQSDNWTC